MTALSIAAVVNVALVLVAFRSFVIELTSNRRAPFYALLAALLLWGPASVAVEWRDPRRLDRLRRALPVDVGVGALPVRAHHREPIGATRLVAADWWRLVALGVGVGAGRVVSSADRRGAGRRRPRVGAVSLPPAGVANARVACATSGGGLGVAMLWPFFPLFDLSPSGFYATSDELFYQSVPQRIFPALLGLIVVYRRSRADWRDPIAWLIVSALVLYGIGTWSGIGRSIIFAVLLLQVAVGDGVGRIEAAWSCPSSRALATGLRRRVRRARTARFGVLARRSRAHDP